MQIPFSFSLYTFIHLLWDVLVFGTCTYVVFWLNQSGWWYLLALLIASGLPSYKSYLDKNEEEDDGC